MFEKFMMNFKRFFNQVKFVLELVNNGLEYLCLF